MRHTPRTHLDLVPSLTAVSPSNSDLAVPFGSIPAGHAEGIRQPGGSGRLPGRHGAGPERGVLERATPGAGRVQRAETTVC